MALATNSSREVDVTRAHARLIATFTNQEPSTPIRRRIVSLLLASALAVGVIAVQALPVGAVGGGDSVVLVDSGGRFDVWVDAAPGSGVGRLVFGDAGDVPVMGDWDCDGVDSPGVFRSSQGRVFVRDSVSPGVADRVFSFGLPGDVPLAGDFDGDGCDSISVYRPSEGRVYVSNELRGMSAEYSFYFGVPGDEPFAGDFDGDGVDTVGVYRPSEGRVFLRDSNTSGYAELSFWFGNAGDRVFAGDWNGDGVDTVAAYRSSNGLVYLKSSHGTGAADSSIPVGSYRYATAASGIPGDFATKYPVPVTPTLASGGVYVPDVHVYPGDGLEGLAAASPAGTVFMVHGVHSGQSVEPKDGQVFVGAGDAVLDGGGWVEFAFEGSASDVVIQGLEIRNYDTSIHFGTVYVSGSRWVVEGNEIHHSPGDGVAVRDDLWTRDDPTDVPRDNVIRNNRIHHHSHLGVTVRGTVGTVIEGNEISYNNWLEEYDGGWEAGGGKFLETEGLIVRNNHSHHNTGAGLWDDINNINTLYDGNLVEDNTGPGIFHEIGYAATIRNNTIRRNGFADQAWLWGAGILIAASQDTEVYGNTVEGNYNGITLIQQDRGDGWYGPWIVQNNRIYDNVVSGGISGAVQDNGDNSIYSANNTFENNAYRGDVTWSWNNDNQMDWNTWRSTGNDTTGTYKP